MSDIRNVLRLGVVLVTASAVLLGLPACAPPEAAPTDVPTPVDAEPIDEEAEITENVAVYAAEAVFPSLDPDLMLTNDHQVGYQAYETLTRWDPDEGVVSGLATSWESNEDGTEWTFRLREDVTFHDGTPFTAEAVRFSYERTLDMGLMDYYLDAVEEMEVIDDHTFRFVLNAPRPMHKIVSAGYGMFIVNPNVADQPEGWFEEGNDAGTGPYTIVNYEPGTRVELTRYPDYWGGWEEGQFTTLVYEFVEDTAVREQMIRAGEANATRGMPWTSYESLQALDHVNVETPDVYYNYLYFLHMGRPPLDDHRVRKALAHSYPYEDVQRGTYGGRATIAQGVVPVGLWEPPADWETHNHDLEEAGTLLEEAGYGDGLELRLAVVAGVEEWKDMAQLWQGELAAIGVDLRIEEVSSGSMWDALYDPDTRYDIVGFDWAAGYASPYEFTILYHSANTFAPFMGYSNPEVDGLMIDGLVAEALGEVEEANRLYTEVQRILRDEAAAVFVLDFPMFFAFRSDTVGFVSNPVQYDVIHWYDMRVE